MNEYKRGHADGYELGYERGFTAGIFALGGLCFLAAVVAHLWGAL